MMAKDNRFSQRTLNRHATLISGHQRDSAKNDIVLEPTGCDILLGRGTNKQNLNHSGNVWFRKVIHDNLGRYVVLLSSPKKKEKTLIVDDIIKSIQRASGRFLKKKRQDSCHQPEWYIVSPSEAHEKVVHALRDALKASKFRAGRFSCGEEAPSMEYRASENFDNMAAVDVSRHDYLANNESEAVKNGSEHSSVDWVDNAIASLNDEDSWAEVDKEMLKKTPDQALLLSDDDICSFQDCCCDSLHGIVVAPEL